MIDTFSFGRKSVGQTSESQLPPSLHLLISIPHSNITDSDVQTS